MVFHFPNKIIVRCTKCKQNIYSLDTKPKPGAIVSSSHFTGLNQQPDPDPSENPICVYCGAFPFIYNNTGLQVETSDGELIPNDY